MPNPTSQSLLQVLTKERLAELGRELAVFVPSSATKDVRIDRLVSAAPPLPAIVKYMTRDELKAACRTHGFDDSGRSRGALAARLLGDELPSPVAPALFGERPIARELPHKGDIVAVRLRRRRVLPFQ